MPRYDGLSLSAMASKRDLHPLQQNPTVELFHVLEGLLESTGRPDMGQASFIIPRLTLVVHGQGLPQVQGLHRQTPSACVVLHAGKTSSVAVESSMASRVDFIIGLPREWLG